MIIIADVGIGVKEDNPTPAKFKVDWPSYL
jgi:hypothetical protein